MSNQKGMVLLVVLLILSVIAAMTSAYITAASLQYHLSRYQYQHFQSDYFAQELLHQSFNDIINNSACQAAAHSDKWFALQTTSWWRAHPACKKITDNQEAYYLTMPIQENSCDTLNGRYVSYYKVIIHVAKPTKSNLAVIIAYPINATACPFQKHSLTHVIQSSWFF